MRLALVDDDTHLAMGFICLGEETIDILERKALGLRIEQVNDGNPGCVEDLQAPSEHGCERKEEAGLQRK